MAKIFPALPDDAFIQPIASLLGHEPKDLHKLIYVVIGKIEVCGDTASKPFVAFDEVMHFIGISGKNNHHIVTMVFHLLHDGIDGLCTEAVGIVQKRIGFVNEQHTSSSLLKFLFHDLCRPTNILPYQIASPALHKISRGQKLLFLEYPGKQPCHRCLGTTGIAGKDHMKSSPAPLHLAFPSGFSHLMDSNDATKHGFGFFQSHQLFQLSLTELLVWTVLCHIIMAEGSILISRVKLLPQSVLS